MRVTSVALISIALGLSTCPGAAAHAAQVKWVPLNSEKPKVAKAAPQPVPAAPATIAAPAPAVSDGKDALDPSVLDQNAIQELTKDVRVSPAPPDSAQWIALVEEAVKATLKDPYSAHFTWPNGFVQGWYKRPFGRKKEGWITCGTVNAKNSYGGYVGSTAVIGVINGGVVIETNMDDVSAPYGRTEVADVCKKIGVPVR
jgi:hypothetical protein